MSFVTKEIEFPFDMEKVDEMMAINRAGASIAQLAGLSPTELMQAQLLSAAMGASGGEPMPGPVEFFKALTIAVQTAWPQTEKRGPFVISVSGPFHEDAVVNGWNEGEEYAFGMGALKGQKEPDRVA